jgi:hypothetical protein
VVKKDSTAQLPQLRRAGDHAAGIKHVGVDFHTTDASFATAGFGSMCSDLGVSVCICVIGIMTKHQARTAVANVKIGAVEGAIFNEKEILCAKQSVVAPRFVAKASTIPAGMLAINRRGRTGGSVPSAMVDDAEDVLRFYRTFNLVEKAVIKPKPTSISLRICGNKA